jgi:hypothetical protein
MRRAGRPGLVGTMARTAVVAGTATAVSGGMRRRSAGRQQQAALQAQVDAAVAQANAAQAAPPAAPAAPAAAAADDPIAKLKELADLKAAGVLSDEEFAAMKAKILSS